MLIDTNVGFGDLSMLIHPAAGSCTKICIQLLDSKIVRGQNQPFPRDIRSNFEDIKLQLREKVCLRGDAEAEKSTGMISSSSNWKKASERHICQIWIEKMLKCDLFLVGCKNVISNDDRNLRGYGRVLDSKRGYKHPPVA